MELRYKGFLINSMSYSLNKIPTSGNPETNLSMSDGQVVLNQNKSKPDEKSAIVKMSVHAYSKDKEKNKETQSLELHIDFIFGVEKDENEQFNEKTFKKVLTDHVMDFCALRAEDIIKQVTSIDNGRPIVVQTVTLPSGIELMTPKEHDEEKTDK